MLKSLYAAVLLAATVAVPALWPQDAQAQVIVGGPRGGVVVGRPYYGGYGYYNNYYAPRYYSGYNYGYPSYGYGYNTYRSYYAPGYRYWR